jgi:pyruvate dehydrogenase phosphatase
LQKDAPDHLIESAIKEAFVKLDNRIMDDAKRAVEASTEVADPDVISALGPAVAGSCALLSIFDPLTSVLRVACTGDSRAVLGAFSASSTYEALALSKDQTGFNADEVERITREHPGEDGILDPKSGRLLGIAVTRAFGDHRWKWPTEFVKHIQGDYFGSSPRPKALTQPYMTAEPVVTTTSVKASDFVILASDGLWDHISTEDAVECVSQWLAAKKAGKKQPVDKLNATPSMPAKVELKEGWPEWKAKPETFVVEDMDNAAVHLIKNVLGGKMRSLFVGTTVAATVGSTRNVRDDITVQVIFFQKPDVAS